MSTKVRSVLKNSGIAFGILGIATAFCFLVQRISESDTHVPLLFVLAVLFVSRFTDGYVYGIVASIIAVFGVNYVFTFPYFKLNFAITGYPLTFVAMLAVACSVSALTTQIKKQEQMRLEVEREKMRANLLRAVSHDIRTPMNAIMNMTRFLMNLDEAVDLVQFAFEHANPGDLFIQKAPASTIGDLAEAVQEVFGRVGTQVIGTRHGEKLYETLMTCEERLRAEDMGDYFRVACDSRDLNYDKFVVNGEVTTMADEAYTSHNTSRLDVAGTVEKIKTAEYVQLALEGREHEAVQ